jgi:hypothetical protein
MKLLAVLFAFAVCAQPATITTVTADLVSAGPSPLTDSAHEYVGPYTLDVNGHNYAALCVDYSDTATIGHSYSAYETPLSANLTDTYHPTYTTQYEEEAYLFELITQAGVSTANRINIQHAAWSITDASYHINSAAENYVTLAQQDYHSVNLSNFDLISGTSTGSGRAQEFLIETLPAAVAPEPSTIILLSGGLLICAGLYARRKASKT